MLKRKYAVTRDSPLIDMGYKYSTRKVLSFIATEDAGITKAGITYLSNYLDSFANVAICPDYCPIFMT